MPGKGTGSGSDFAPYAYGTPPPTALSLPEQLLQLDNAVARMMERTSVIANLVDEAFGMGRPLPVRGDSFDRELQAQSQGVASGGYATPRAENNEDDTAPPVLSREDDDEQHRNMDDSPNFFEKSEAKKVQSEDDEDKSEQNDAGEEEAVPEQKTNSRRSSQKSRKTKKRTNTTSSTEIPSKKMAVDDGSSNLSPDTPKTHDDGYEADASQEVDEKENDISGQEVEEEYTGDVVVERYVFENAESSSEYVGRLGNFIFDGDADPHNKRKWLLKMLKQRYPTDKAKNVGRAVKKRRQRFFKTMGEIKKFVEKQRAAGITITQTGAKLNGSLVPANLEWEAFIDSTDEFQYGSRLATHLWHDMKPPLQEGEHSEEDEERIAYFRLALNERFPTLTNEADARYKNVAEKICSRATKN